MAISHEAPKIILAQLGGSQFIAMTGSNNFVGGEKSLSFKVGRNAKGITHVRIVLDDSDLYIVEFLKIRGTNVKTEARLLGVYCDMLQSVFTEYTGLYTRL